MEASKSSKSTGSLGADDVDDNFEDEDHQSQEDFQEFQRWLVQGSPAKSIPISSGSGSSDVSMPPPAPPTVAGCKCFKNPCDFDWNLSPCLYRSILQLGKFSVV